MQGFSPWVGAKPDKSLETWQGRPGSQLWHQAHLAEDLGEASSRPAAILLVQMRQAHMWAKCSWASSLPRRLHSPI